MKTKVKIVGLRVHDVGYRPFLIALADEFAIQKFEVHNSVAEGRQLVIAKIEADDDQFQAFMDAVRSRKPKKAEVSDIGYELFEGSVRSIVRTSMMSMNAQLAKGIDTIENISGKMDQMLEDQEETTEAVRDLKHGDERFARMEKDILTIKSKLGIR
jgi:acylphosphatase